MLFEKGAGLYAYEIRNENGENVIYVNYMGAPIIPSIVSYPEVMARVVDILIENPLVSRVVLVQQRNYNYNYEQIQILSEIASIYNFLLKQEKVLSIQRLSGESKIGNEILGLRYEFMNMFLQLLRQDPISAYLILKNKIIEEQRNNSIDKFYLLLLQKIFSLLDKSKLLNKLEKKIDQESLSDRSIYSQIFSPDIIPNFAFSRLMVQLPNNSKIISQYEIGEGLDKSVVTILKKEGELKYFYHLMPPEYFLNEDLQYLLNLARNVLIEHQPKAEEFSDSSRTRQIFFNVSRDLLRDLAISRNINISYEDLGKLAGILVRHTIGFGLLEVLLEDINLQDIVFNAPISLNTVFLRHSKFDECVTNIILSPEDAESWAAKFRMMSGRPLDEANPVLDSDLVLERSRARVAAIGRPLSPNGLSYAFRRHRDFPWTLPLFINNRMINSFGAGLLSFLIDGSRTMLIAGTRSSGKTSLLGSLMLEIKPKYRMIVVEDTPELPVESFRKMGYDILNMKVRPGLIEGSNEVSAEDGIRTSLRLGDSGLIVGEIRSNEAKALYEAMRVGALANVVAGTVHGSSPYSVFDRIVNDLQVPITSFKATDIIVVANPVKTPDGLHSNRRVVQISEVRKHWTHDPETEKGFRDLLNYDVEKDDLVASDDLINGDSEIIKEVASGVKGWAGNWDNVYDNILLRGQIKQEIVDISKKLKREDLLEAKFCLASNNLFHEVSDEITQEIGVPLGKRVFPLWRKRIDDEIKRMS